MQKWEYRELSVHKIEYFSSLEKMNLKIESRLTREEFEPGWGVENIVGTKKTWTFTTEYNRIHMLNLAGSEGWELIYQGSKPHPVFNEVSEADIYIVKRRITE